MDCQQFIADKYFFSALHMIFSQEFCRPLRALRILVHIHGGVDEGRIVLQHPGRVPDSLFHQVRHICEARIGAGHVHAAIPERKVRGVAGNIIHPDMGIDLP